MGRVDIALATIGDSDSPSSSGRLSSPSWSFLSTGNSEGHAKPCRATTRAPECGGAERAWQLTASGNSRPREHAPDLMRVKPDFGKDHAETKPSAPIGTKSAVAWMRGWTLSPRCGHAARDV